MSGKIENSKGNIYYGMHFYPGVAEYAELGNEPVRVFLNEDTIRNMDPTFAGRPIYVDHVDKVEQNVDALRGEVDGWVIESFFNQADGKHWVKFIVVSELGERAIQSGFRLSNAYIPSSYGNGGQWNGVSYAREITAAQYEHLAIVQNPRYEESVIMSPEQFKQYNDNQVATLKRLANSKDQPIKENGKMKLNIFKRQKVENSVDFDGLVVELPKSKKEMTLTQLVSDHDAILNMNGYANGDHMVKVGEDEMSVNDLVKKHMEMCNSAKDEAEMKNAGEGEPGEDIENDNDEDGTIAAGVRDVGSRGGDKSLDNEEDEDSVDNEDDEEAPAEKKKNAVSIKNEKLRLAKEKAARLKNANTRQNSIPRPTIETSVDQVARGKSRYGSSA